MQEIHYVSSQLFLVLGTRSKDQGAIRCVYGFVAVFGERERNTVLIRAVSTSHGMSSALLGAACRTKDVNAVEHWHCLGKTTPNGAGGYTPRIRGR